MNLFDNALADAASVQPNRRAVLIDSITEADSTAEISYANLYLNSQKLAQLFAYQTSSDSVVVVTTGMGLVTVTSFLGLISARRLPLIQQLRGADWRGELTRLILPIVGREVEVNAVVDPVWLSYAERSQAVLFDVDGENAALVPLSQPRRRLGLCRTESAFHGSIGAIQMTSGSTGSPGLVLLPMEGLERSAQQCVDHWELEQDSVALCWTPPSHILAVMLGILAPLVAGSATVWLSPKAVAADPLIWAERISYHRATHSAAPNFAYDWLVSRYDQQRLSGIDLSCWKAAITGGEVVRLATIQAFMEVYGRHGVAPTALCSSYGFSENSGFVTSSRVGKTPTLARPRRDDAPVRDFSSNSVEAVSCGTPPPDTKILILNESDDSIVPESCLGEIVVYCPTMARQVIGREVCWFPASAESDDFPNEHRANLVGDDQYYRTGDTGFMLDGQLYVVGRTGDLIRYRARNVVPGDIESIAAMELGPQGAVLVAFGFETGAEELVVLSVELFQWLPWKEVTAMAKRVHNEIYRQLGVTVSWISFGTQGYLPRTDSGKVHRKHAKMAFGQEEYRGAIERAVPVRCSVGHDRPRILETVSGCSWYWSLNDGNSGVVTYGYAMN